MLILEIAKDETPKNIPDSAIEDVGGDEVIGERKRLLRRRMFWWLFTRSSVLLSLMTVLKLAFVLRMRMKKIKWLENPCAFDTRSLLDLSLQEFI